MKVYSLKGAVARQHRLWARFSVLYYLVVAIAYTQPALAQPSTIGQWEEPPPVDGDYAWPLKAIHGSLMPDGQILTWQSDGETARLWRTTTGAFTCMPVFNTPLFCSGHASLADGSLLIAGGGYGGFGVTDINIYRYGPSMGGGGPWEIGHSMNFGRWYPTCTTLADGQVLVISGKRNFNQEIVFVTIPEIYDPVQDTWDAMVLADKQIPLYPFMFQLPEEGKVFFAGPRKNTYVLNMITGQWDADPIVAEYFASDGTAAMYEPGKIVRIGGISDDVIQSAVELIDFNVPNPQWSTASPLIEARHEHQNVLLADGTVLVVGGVSPNAGGGESATKVTELFDPATGTWSLMAEMTYNRVEHAIALLQPDGRILSAGGNGCGNVESDDCDFGGFPSTYCNAEVFSPPYLFAGSRPVIGFAPASVIYIADFTVSLSTSSLITTSGIAKVSFVRLGAATHNFDQNQRYVPLNFEVRDDFTLVVEAPLNGNIAPPGYYMLFLISTAGVPSEAKFVQLQ